MAMNYTTLVGAKTLSGSIASWTGYGPLVAQADTILTEAQSLIYQQLRTRELRTQWIFGMGAKTCRIALPARFLDPIGRLVDNGNGIKYRHKTESDIVSARAYDNSLSGTFGANPFTTTSAGSGTVTVTLTAHGLNQGSDITITGAPTVDGISLNGTQLVTAIVDANSFTISVDGGSATAGAVTGGGSGVTYTANNLIAGSPTQWAIWDEFVHFDQAFDTATQFRMLYFRSQPVLSTTNQTNFLTNRYPLILRKACQCAAADWMKDDGEYQKSMTALIGLIQATNAESDLMYRGADLNTETP